LWVIIEEYAKISSVQTTVSDNFSPFTNPATMVVHRACDETVSLVWDPFGKELHSPKRN
jgi:hypothetical protein